jgi:hypothetical protein
MQCEGEFPSNVKLDKQDGINEAFIIKTSTTYMLMHVYLSEMTACFLLA